MSSELSAPSDSDLKVSAHRLLARVSGTQAQRASEVDPSAQRSSHRPVIGYLLVARHRRNIAEKEISLQRRSQRLTWTSVDSIEQQPCQSCHIQPFCATGSNLVRPAANVHSEVHKSRATRGETQIGQYEYCRYDVKMSLGVVA